MTVAKLFVDTAPFIYLLENNADFYQPVATYLAQTVQANAALVTSVITYTEFCVKPQQPGRQDLIRDFDVLLNELGVEMVEIPFAAAVTAYQLRARYTFLKGMDSLQIAAAINAGCEVFFTNDRKLQHVTELSVVLVADV